MGRLTRFVALLVLAWAGIVGLLYLAQASLIFPANTARVDLARAGLIGWREQILTTGDGVDLISWTIAPPAAGRPVVVYFHGNGGNLNSRGRVERVRALAAGGFGVLIVSWRGYGGSQGSPGEDGLHQDAATALAAARQLYPGASLVLYGESLGTGPAVRLAAREPVAALVLEAPFLSVLAVAQGQYPFVPVAPLLKHPFRSDLWIGSVSAPVLILHGGRDGVVPVGQGEALYALAREPKRLFLAREAGHEDLPAFGSLTRVARFIEDAVAGRVTGAATETVP